VVIYGGNPKYMRVNMNYALTKRNLDCQPVHWGKVNFIIAFSLQIVYEISLDKGK